MKRGRISCWLSIVVLISSVFACTSNLEVRRKQGEASRNLGEVYLQQGNYTAALREFLKAEELNPEDPFLHYGLGLTYRAKGKPDLAIEHFRKALRINPDYSAARNGLGTAYLAKRDWDAAIKAFEEVAENILYATPELPLSNLGLAYYQKGDYASAQKYYMRALELKPGFINALVGLGRTYMALGKPSEAVKSLETGARYYPRSGAVFFDLGKAYTMSGEYPKALRAFEKVSELAPDSPLAEEALKEAQRVKALY